MGEKRETVNYVKKRTHWDFPKKKIKTGRYNDINRVDRYCNWTDIESNK